MKKRRPQGPNESARRRSASRRPSTPPLLVRIEKPIYGGAFLARVEGKAIFTPLTLPGEQARVRTIDDHTGWANAELEELVAASPERVVPACPHFGPCGGCHYQQAGYEAQLAIKQAVLRETFERAGIAPPAEIAVVAGHPWAYRNRIRLALDSAGNIGYRGRRSHAVIPIRECPIAAPLLIQAAFAAASYFRRFPFAQRPSELSLFCDAAESTLLVTAILANPAKPQVEDFARALAPLVPALAGVEFTSEGLAGRQPHTAAHWGSTSLIYRAGGIDYRVDHGAFFQVNRRLVDSLVNCVMASHRGPLAWDLFAGVGLFARQLASRFQQVIAVESAPAALPALRANLAGTAATAVQATTLDFLLQNRASPRPDLIVVDPPRTGLGGEVSALLAEVSAQALVYVSCDPATLARDLGVLLASGYAVESLTLADLFPQTFHIESVVQLRRA